MTSKVVGGCQSARQLADMADGYCNDRSMCRGTVRDKRAGSIRPNRPTSRRLAYACGQALELSLENVPQHLAVQSQIGNNLLQPDRHNARPELTRQTLTATTRPRQRNNMIPEFRRVRVPCSRHANTLFDKSKSAHQTGGSPMTHSRQLPAPSERKYLPGSAP